MISTPKECIGLIILIIIFLIVSLAVIFVPAIYIVNYIDKKTEDIVPNRILYVTISIILLYLTIIYLLLWNNQIYKQTSVLL